MDSTLYIHEIIILKNDFFPKHIPDYLIRNPKGHHDHCSWRGSKQSEGHNAYYTKIIV